MAEDAALRALVERELPARLTPRDRDRGLWERLFPKEAEGADGALAAHGANGPDGGTAMASADAADHALSPRAEG